MPTTASEPGCPAGGPRCPRAICDCFIEEFPDDPLGLHPELYEVVWPAERLVWVSLPHATYGIVVADGVVVAAPPIARWMIGKPERDVAAWLRRHGAHWQVLP